MTPDAPSGDAEDRADPRASPLVGALALALFFVSGATALVYEVGWTRRLLLTLGSTTTASAVVLSVFLGGLGLGALVGGRRADRSSRPLAWYGLFEVLAGVWALAVPVVLPLLEGPYVSVARAAPFLGPPLRVVVAAAVVFPGAFLVGTTFPLLLRAVARRAGRVGASAAVLYGANTLGAVAGALWAGFHGIFEHGVLGSTRLAAFVAIGTGVLAGVLGTVPRARRAPAPPEALSRRTPVAPLALAAFSGFVALGLEAAGARILVFFVEGFTASFAAMLGVFLGGLAVGSLVLGPGLARRASVRVAAGVLLACAGASVLGATLLLPHVEGVLRGIRAQAFAAHAADPMAAQRWTAIAGSALLFLLPSVALGSLFPLCVRWATGDGAQAVGRAAGRCGLWNSLGCVAGPLAVLGVGALGGRDATAGGPLLAWSLLGFLALAGGLWLAGRTLLAESPGRSRLLAGGLAGLLLGALGAQVLAASTPEALVRAGRVLRGPDGRPDPARVLVEARSDEVTTASVVGTPPNDLTLYTDEFSAASTGSAYLYMSMLGHLPVLGAKDPENAMVVAFGTGTTAGAVAAHDAVRRLDVVEVSSAVLALAPRFREANFEVLEDPRVVRRVDDGRHAVLLHAPDLDVITLEPLMPYVPSALPFYTREFYELARDRLRDGGVLCQWVPVHAMPLDLYASLLRTFFEVFPDGSLWYFEQSTILIGHKGPRAAVDTEALRARMKPVQRRIRALGVTRPSVLVLGWVASGRRVLQVLDDPSASSEEAIRRSPPGPLSRRVVRDETPFPEAHPTPRGGLTSHLSDTLLWLSGLVSPSDDPAAVPETALASPAEMPLLRNATRGTLRARAIEAIGDHHLRDARIASARGRASEAADLRAKARSAWQQAAEAHAALATTPAAEDLTVVRRRARLDRVLGMEEVRDRLAEAEEARRRGDAVAAKAALDEAAKRSEPLLLGYGLDALVTERPAAYALRGEVLLRQGRCAAAEELLTKARLRWPWDPRLADLAAFAAARRRGTEASLGARLEALGDLPRAVPACSDEATAATRTLVASWATAFAAGRLGDVRRAGDLLRAAVRRDGIDGAAVAAEVGEAVRPSTKPALQAERAALLRALSAADEDLLHLLESPDEVRRSAALRAAARVGFEAARSVETVDRAFVRAEAADRRLAFVAVALDDGGAWALGRLADLLKDPDLAVREAAWKALTVRMPAEVRDRVGYDPRGDEPARAAAAAAAAAWAATATPSPPK